MTRVAAVDVGSNSVRLLVADARTQESAPLASIERQMQITRLGAGVDETGHLDDAALARTLEAIVDFAERWRALDVERVRLTATSAVRDAADRARFFDGVRDLVGVDAEVLTGAQEAALAFAGATATIVGESPYCVLDIGGGSTELIVGERDAEAMSSQQLGCVRLTERVLASDPPTAAELDAARATVAERLDDAARRVDVHRAQTLVGVAGTVTTLAALHLGLDTYDADAIHGTRVPCEAVAALTAQLAALPAAKRAELGPMQPGREDVIVGGALILEAVLERFGFAAVLVSESDILDGLALSLR